MTKVGIIMRMGFREKLIGFMYGRYGFDKLGGALIVLYLILGFLNLFFRSFILYFISLALMIWAIFRMFSKNIAARRRENAVAEKVIDKILWFFRQVKNFFVLQKNRIRDRKTSVYRRCPTCKNVLRLPRKKGDHTVCCPCCHNRFEVKVRF